MLEKCLENAKGATPLVHCITNYVTANDVANVTLACGGSPIMADEPKEAEDIAKICNAECINIGTLNEKSIEAMFIAGRAAKEKENIILLDPVGAGASNLRTETAIKILESLSPNIIRGNISEIKALATGSGTTKGVDADIADTVTEENLREAVLFVKNFAQKTNAVIAATGKIDLVTNGKECYVIRNGSAKMSKITGTGCMLSAVATVYAAANKNNITEAVAAAVCVMGVAGEIGESKMKKDDGNCTLRGYIIDAIYNMNSAILKEGAKYEVR